MKLLTAYKNLQGLIAVAEKKGIPAEDITRLRVSLNTLYKTATEKEKKKTS